MKKFEKEMMMDKFIDSPIGGILITVVVIAVFMAIVSGVMTLIFG